MLRDPAGGPAALLVAASRQRRIRTHGLGRAGGGRGAGGGGAARPLRGLGWARSRLCRHPRGSASARRRPGRAPRSERMGGAGQWDPRAAPGAACPKDAERRRYRRRRPRGQRARAEGAGTPERASSGASDRAPTPGEGAWPRAARADAIGSSVGGRTNPSGERGRPAPGPARANGRALVARGRRSGNLSREPGTRTQDVAAPRDASARPLLALPLLSSRPRGGPAGSEVTAGAGPLPQEGLTASPSGPGRPGTRRGSRWWGAGLRRSLTTGPGLVDNLATWVTCPPPLVLAGVNYVPVQPAPLFRERGAPSFSPQACCQFLSAASSRRGGKASNATSCEAPAHRAPPTRRLGLAERIPRAVQSASSWPWPFHWPRPPPAPPPSPPRPHHPSTGLALVGGTSVQLPTASGWAQQAPFRTLAGSPRTGRQRLGLQPLGGLPSWTDRTCQPTDRAGNLLGGSSRDARDAGTAWTWVGWRVTKKELREVFSVACHGEERAPSVLVTDTLRLPLPDQAGALWEVRRSASLGWAP
ncbi:uncharacterized protein [Canis lupus baileyi]|uniref:uncharacterized protein n=1 Tax=Canis lupus baileyi TaxID=143281 RepID=UPI003B979D15